tara:strand:- start:160 stop:570 length:411 start_codon:yes stop_codon:yes gene_type:complete
LILRNLHIILFSLFLGNFSYAQQISNKIHIEEQSKITFNDEVEEGEEEDKEKKENQFDPSASSDNDFETATIENGNINNSDRSQIQQSKHGEVSSVKKNSKIKRFFSRIWNSIDLYCKRNNFSKKKLYNLLIGNLY